MTHHGEGNFQTGHRVPVKEQSPRSKPVWIQKRSLHRNSPEGNKDSWTEFNSPLTVNTHSHTHTHTHTHIHTHKHTRAHSNTHIQVNMHTREHTHLNTNTDTRLSPKQRRGSRASAGL